MEAAPPSSRRSRVLVADDHPLYRDALKQMLGRQPDLEVVGEAEDGREALELCRRLRPDLVLMDMRMPNMDGLEATRAMKREFPGVSVVVLTAFEDEEYLTEALRAGAKGYVLKHSTNQRIIESIRRVLGSEYALDQQLSIGLLARFAEEKEKREEERGTSKSLASEGTSPRVEHQVPVSSRSFTPREVEVLRLVALGRTNRQIARSLRIGVSTVKGHLERIYSKLGVCDRTQAVVRSLELGLVSIRERD